MSINLHEVPVILDKIYVSESCYEHIKVVDSSVRSDHKAIVAYNGNIKTAVTKSRTAKVYRKVTPAQHASFCARRDSIERNSYGNVAGWLGVRHTPVLYQNG